MKKLSNLIYFVLTFALLLIADIYISGIIYGKILSGWRFSGPFMNITYAQNTGAAFSIMQNSTNFLIGLSILTLLVIFVYVLRFLTKTSKKNLLLLAFLSAGISGNLIQRLSLGYVRDYFEFSFFNFPIFNISDIFITIAVTGIAISILFSRKPIKLL